MCSLIIAIFPSWIREITEYVTKLYLKFHSTFFNFCNYIKFIIYFAYLNANPFLARVGDIT